MVLSQFVECSQPINKYGTPSAVVNIALITDIFKGTYGKEWGERDWHYIKFRGERDVLFTWMYAPDKLDAMEADYKRLLTLNTKPDHNGARIEQPENGKEIYEDFERAFKELGLGGYIHDKPAFFAIFRKGKESANKNK